jgi:hypothetical protein
MHSVFSVLPIHGNIVHDHLLLFRAQMILAPLDRAAPVGASTWEVVGVVLVGKTNNAPTFMFCRAKIVRSLAILVKVAQHLAIAAGVAATMASEASCFSTLGGRCTSSEVEGLYLIELALPLAELWVLPYKGPEVA